MHEAVPSIASLGVSPIVRIPDLQGWMVKRVCPILIANVPGLSTVADALLQVRWTAGRTG